MRNELVDDDVDADQPRAVNVCCSPLWHGVAIILLTLTPLCMVMSELTNIYKDGFGEWAYWGNNIANLLNAVVSAPALALAGHFSQPHRFGRRAILLANALFFCGFFLCCLTMNAYTISFAYVGLGLFGGLNGSITVIFAWITDWAEPEAKVKYFAIVQGFAFAAVTAGPFIAIVVKEAFGDQYAPVLFRIALGSSLASPLYILAVFPKTSFPDGVIPDDTPSLRRRFSMNPSPRSSPQDGPSEESREGVVKVARDMKKMTQWMFKQYPAVATTYIITNFADTALQSNALLYLNEERGFDQVSLNTLIFALGFTSFFVQCFGVPVATHCGISQYCLLFVSVLATIAHIGVYAGVTVHAVIILLEPLGAFAYIISIAGTGIISGVPSLGGVPVKDQGTLLGVLTAFKTLATCVSPILLAATTTHWRQFPSPFNVAGIGFWILVVLMLPAVPLATWAWVRNSRRPLTESCCEDAS